MKKTLSAQYKGLDIKLFSPVQKNIYLKGKTEISNNHSNMRLLGKMNRLIF
jgi:hypothetical protein